MYMCVAIRRSRVFRGPLPPLAQSWIAAEGRRAKLPQLPSQPETHRGFIHVPVLKGSMYCPFKDSGSKDYTCEWILEPESFNGQYRDPVG